MPKRDPASSETRTRLLDAALHVMRLKGYAATTVDDICQAAELTKGSFFHHFASKEALGLAAAEHFAAMAGPIFSSAPYQRLADPVDRLLGYVDFRIAILTGSICEFSCLLGTFVQELYDTHPAIRAACEKHMTDHIAMLARDVAEARDRYVPDAPWTPESLAIHMQAVLQGALIFAKARQSADPAVESLAHLRRYIDRLFPGRPDASAGSAGPAGAAAGPRKQEVP